MLLDIIKITKNRTDLVKSTDFEVGKHIQMESSFETKPNNEFMNAVSDYAYVAAIEILFRHNQK